MGTARTGHRHCLLVAPLLVIFGPESTSGQSHAPLFDATGSSAEARARSLTLAGIVNRDSARLYLLSTYKTLSYASTDDWWHEVCRSRAGVQFDSIATLGELVDRFRPLIRGAVLYDSSETFSNFPGQLFRWQAEYAALIGGLTDRLSTTLALASALGLERADSILLENQFDADAPVWVPGSLSAASLAWNAPGLNAEERYLALLDWGGWRGSSRAAIPTASTSVRSRISPSSAGSSRSTSPGQETWICPRCQPHAQTSWSAS